MMRSVTQTGMSQLIAAFTSYLREQRMRGDSTVIRYRKVLVDFGAFLEAKADDSALLESAAKSDLIDFLRLGVKRAGEPSRSVWNMRLAALRAFYDFLFKAEIVDANPALKIDRLKTCPRVPVPLSLDEYLALAEAMEQSPRACRTRNAAIVHVFFHCALRVAELASLCLQQLDLENHMLLDVRTKGKKWLSIELNDVVEKALKDYLRERHRIASPGERALFVTRRGHRLSVRAIQELIRCYGKRAGISRPVTPHLLRHSSATELAELGTELRVIRDICNHASVTTTERYVHGRSEARRRALTTLGVQTLARRSARDRGRNAQPPAKSHHSP